MVRGLGDKQRFRERQPHAPHPSLVRVGQGSRSAWVWVGVSVTASIANSEPLRLPFPLNTVQRPSGSSNTPPITQSPNNPRRHEGMLIPIGTGWGGIPSILSWPVGSSADAISSFCKPLSQIRTCGRPRGVLGE